MLTERQKAVLAKVVATYQETGQPVGSKALAADTGLGAGPSTIRNELAILEEQGLLAHPHTSAGRVPTDAGFRFFVDELLPERRAVLSLELIRRELDEAMRTTTETLSQVTNLLAIVTAPPIQTASVRHVEVLVLQPQVLMVVVITSTGGVSKRVFTYDNPVDPGLAAWAGEYLDEELKGVGLGSRSLGQRLAGPGLGEVERRFLEGLAPAFRTLDETAEDSLFFDGAARLLGEHRIQDLSQINELMGMLERRVELLGAIADAVGADGVVVRIGAENAAPQLRSLALVASAYGLPARQLGAVSVIGPVHMDYGTAVASVREAARQLSRFVEDVYE